MDDILEQFKTFVKNKKPILNENNKRIILGEFQYAIDTKVKYQTSTITVGQLWFCLKTIKEDQGTYLKLCKEQKIDAVPIPTRLGLKTLFNIDDTSLFQTTSGASLDASSEKKRDSESAFEEGAESSNRKRLKPFESTLLSSEREFGEKEKESKQQFISFLSNILQSEDTDSKDLDAYIPYLEYDRTQVINYVNSKEIPFSNRITQTQIEKEYVDKKNNSSTHQTQHHKQSFFTTYLENIQRCKRHLVQHKKDEERKRKEKEKKEKEEGYNQANVKLNLAVKGKFSEENVWQAAMGDDAVEDLLQIDTRGSNIVPLGNDDITPAASVSSDTFASSGNGSSSQADRKGDKNKPSKKSLPIILLPPGRSSLLTLFNVKDFLQKGTFVSTEQKKESAQGAKPKEVVIKHPKTGQQYLVLDTTKNMSKSDWDRVVAIFTIGQVWQFKDSNNWFATEPAVIFDRKKGFALVYENEALNPNVQNWNVEKLYISRVESKRHTDSTVARKFWSAIGVE